MKSSLIHLAQLVFDSPLAILPEKLDTILRAVGPRLAVDDAALTELRSSGVLHSHTTDGVRAFDDDEEWSGSSNSNSGRPYKLTSDGIAVIPVSGVLMKKGSWMSTLSGCSSYDQLSKSIDAAMSDTAVKGVLFDIDSPGGTTHGCFELADKIHSYRGTKPMYACANDLAASAAYAIASSADQIYLTRTAGVGSVGVYALHCDQSGADEQMGVKYTYVFFGDKKTDGNPHEALSKSAKRDIQSEVDREGDIFVATVARNRGISKDKVTGTQAGVFFADQALSAGFADAVGTVDDCLSALTRKVLDNSGMLHLQSDAAVTGKVNAAKINMTEIEQEQESDMAKSNLEVTSKKADEADGSYSKKAEDADEAKKGKKAEEADDSADADAKKSKKADDECDPDKMKKADKPSNNDDDDDDDEDKPKGKKGVMNPAKRIAELCLLAGCPDKVAEFISKDMSVSEVRDALLEMRSTASAEQSINSNFDNSAGKGAGAALETLDSQAATMADASGGKLTKEQAYTKLLLRNPAAYGQVRDHMADAEVHGSAAQRQYLGALGRLPEARRGGTTS